MEEYLKSLQDSRIVDPLSDVTRKERGILLGASLATFAFTTGIVVPEEVKILGITIKEPQQASLMLILSIILGYLIAMFYTCVYADLQLWLVAKRRDQRSLRKGVSHLFEAPAKKPTTNTIDNVRAGIQDLLNRSPETFHEDVQVRRDLIFVSTVRIMIFDTAIPLLAGTFALSLSVSRSAVLSSYPNRGIWMMLSHPWPFFLVITLLILLPVADFLRRKRKNRPTKEKLAEIRKEQDKIYAEAMNGIAKTLKGLNEKTQVNEAKDG